MIFTLAEEVSGKDMPSISTENKLEEVMVHCFVLIIRTDVCCCNFPLKSR